MMSKKNKIIVGIFLILLVVFAFCFYNRTVVVVGDYKITAKDISYKNKLNKIYYPHEPNEYGKEQLIKAYTYAQILKNNGLVITDQILEAEENRINDDTKAPEVLQKIKDIFKHDLSEYRKVFILPTFAERTIYFDFFNKNKEAQSKSLQNVHRFLQMIEETKRPLSVLAAQNKYQFRPFTLSKENGIEWEKKQEKKTAPQKMKAENAAPANVQKALDEKLKNQADETTTFWIDNVISRMKPGQIVQEPVDSGENWLVVKYVRNLSKNSFAMEAVFIPKDSYDEWLNQEKSKIKIK